MEVHISAHIPLTVDTNIAYHIDMSKFPGLDGPEHKYQPALLIASPQDSVEIPHDPLEIIPSPTLSLPTEIDMLDELLSNIDWEPQMMASNEVSPPVQPSTHHSHHHVLQSEQRADLEKPDTYQHACDPRPSTQPTPSMSRYAMDVIFQKLIYPDFSNGGSVSLDSLVMMTTVRADSSIRARDSSHCVGSTLNAPGPKRKRSRGVYESELSERQTLDIQSRTSDYNPTDGVLYTGYRPRPLHRRVRELMC